MTKTDILSKHDKVRCDVKSFIEDYLKLLKDEKYSDREFAERIAKSIDPDIFADNYIIRIHNLKIRIRSKALSMIGSRAVQSLKAKDVINILMFNGSKSEVFAEYTDPSSLLQQRSWVTQGTGMSRSLWDLYCMLYPYYTNYTVPRFIDDLISASKEGPIYIYWSYCSDVRRTVFWTTNSQYINFGSNKQHNCLFIKPLSLIDIKRVFEESRI